MDKSLYTAREILEIKGSFFYMMCMVTIGIIALLFQVLAEIKITNLIFSVIFLITALSLSYIIFTRKKKKLNTTALEWVIGILSIIIPLVTKINYARTLDWTYASQSYHLSAMAIAFLAIVQFLYNKKIVLAMAVILFSFWLVFLLLAAQNGVVIHETSIVAGAVIHDGIQLHREIYYLIMLLVVAVISYRNIPVIEEYDAKNNRQRDVIMKQAASQNLMTHEIKEKMGRFLEELNQQNKVVDDFNLNMQNQAAMFEEISSTIEELFGSADNISNNAKVQLDKNKKMEEIINEFKSTKQLTEANLEGSLENINSVVKKTTTGNERLETVEITITRIKDESKAIADTVNIIIEIADKINLLSLNASIEAARAGDYGRGFAVVADEIGKLAYQTSESIKEIEKVLSQNTRTTTEGVDVIRSAAVIIKEMIDNINKGAEGIKGLKESISVEEQHIGKIVNQLGENIDLAKNIGVGTDEQKIAIETVAKAVEKANEDMAGMLDGITNIVKTSKFIYNSAETLVRISEEAAQIHINSSLT